MKIVFTAKGKDWHSEMDPRFGRTEFLLVYDEEKDELTTYDNSDANRQAHGVGPITAQKLFDLEPDVLITGNGPGGNAARILQKGDFEIYTGAVNMTVKEAYDKFKNDELSKF
ncbi:MAG: dinitrogenase iron-molybdenum cofactor biosynthesis protein [Candidatus Cloacimonetes bacterium]|nr:dinitrogenase iron-molybdenum cofactor biosynthesis protein [Candidatus Cloacimonadota bacterium]